VIETTIDGVECSGDDMVARVVARDGRAWSFDLYVDCTGTRSLLLGEALGTRFVDYASSLWTDRAIIADVPHSDPGRPCTGVETMAAGWCWRTPLRDREDRGYIYASSAIGDADAVAEMRARIPALGAHQVVHFRSGRREQCWRGNVVAIGSSYAFIDPLQSSASQMAVTMIEQLIEWFPERTDARAFHPIVNAKVAERWDQLRYYIAAHYRYNRKADTPFWRACRASADISGVQAHVDLFRESSSTSQRFPELDALFLGLGLETMVQPAESEAEWRRISAALDRIVERALPHGEALQAVASHPEILSRHAEALARS
jgi:tryptophan halogenase